MDGFTQALHRGFHNQREKHLPLAHSLNIDIAMIIQPIVFPTAVKSLTLAAGGTLNISPGWILSAKTQGSGTSIIYQDEAGIITSALVTDSVATVVAATTLFLVTPSTGAKYIRAETVAQLYTKGTGSTLRLLSDDIGRTKDASLDVSESVATIQARIAAAIIAGAPGGGSTFNSYTAAGTTQGTATATNTAFIRITGGGADTGVVLDTATGGEVRVITNATTTRKFYYPASGDNFTGQADNLGMSLQPNETVVLYCSLATEWSRHENVNVQSATATGTTQGAGVAIPANTEVLLLTTAIGNTAATFAAGFPGMRCRVVNVGTAVARLFPASGGTINGGAADAVYQLDAGSTCVLVCNVAGAWVDETSQIHRLAVNFLMPTVQSGSLDIEDPVLGRIGRFSTGGHILDRGVLLFQAAGTATPGGGQVGGVQVASNIYNIETCATNGDSATLTAVVDWAIVKNSGAATAAVFCPNSQTMDGVSDGFASIPPGESYLFYQSITASQWISMPLGESAQSLTGSSTQTQAAGTKVRGSVVTLATISVALDAFTIDPTSGVKEFVVFNNAGVSGSLFPPVGGTIDGGATDAVFVVPRSCAFLLTTVNGLDYKVYLLPGATQIAVADAGSTQATGTPVVAPYVNITTVATAGDAVSAKKYSPRLFYLWNRDSTEALDFFPTVGGTVNGGAVDAAFSIAAGTGYRISSFEGLTWLAERVSDTYRGSATLVAGAFTFNAGAIGAAQVAKITALTGFKRLGITAVNAGTVGTDFVLTIVAGTSLAIQAVDAAGANLNTDVSTIQYEISF